MIGKIAYFSRSVLDRCEANAIHVVKQCSALQKRVPVHLFSIKGKGELSKEALCGLYGLGADFDRTELGFRRWPLRSHLYGLRSALKAKQLKVKYAYGRCHYSLYYAAQFGIQVALELHDLPLSSSQTHRRIIPKLLRSSRLEGVVTITEALAQDVANTYGSPAKPILVLPDAADEPDHTAPAAPLVPNDSNLQIGYCGSLYPGKGCELIVQLAKICPNYHFHIVGGRPIEIEHWKIASKGAHNITFHGRVAPSAVSSYLKAFDILLAPFQNRIESVGGNDISRWTSPLKLFEYMAHGKPIVCSDLEVIREVMNNDGNCLLVVPNDLEGWRRALNTLESTLQLRSRLSTQARSDFLNYYSWDRRADKILQLYKCNAP